MSLEPVPEGKIAAVVTYLEMHERPEVAVPPSLLRLARIERPEADAYRSLFARVGSPWLWFSRLVMADAELEAIIRHPAVELFEVRDGAAVAGMLELDAREAKSCELSFVGLVPGLTGRGHGRWLLSEAVTRAWDRPGVARIHVHTCSLDHPAALSAYRRAGFVAVRRAVETFIDPRLAGVLPLTAAPHIPLVGARSI